MNWWLALFGSTAVAVAQPVPMPPMPSAIAAHVHAGHFDPGDYGWLRGSLPDADPAAKAAWAAIAGWQQRCWEAAPRQDAVLKALGYSAPATYWRPYAPDICAEVGIATATAQGFKSWPSYTQALAAALSVQQTFLFAVGQAVSVGPGLDDSVPLRDRLVAITVPDQMLRSALSWGEGEAQAAPALAPDVRRVVTALQWRPIRDRDHLNTTWLKAQVAHAGWPTISQVGPVAASSAWLLVQHADDDPVFQLQMLNLMEPLVVKGEVKPHDFALLTDRVLLPLTGKQRFGSQFTCKDGQMQPLPLEDAARVDARRKALGLPSIANYARELATVYGEHCS